MRKTVNQPPLWKPLALLGLFSLISTILAGMLHAGPTVTPTEDIFIPEYNLITNAPQQFQTEPVTGPQRWLTLMCRFPDVAGEPQPASFFKNMFERTNGPSLTSYWREVSYNNITGTSTDVFGWFQLPNPRSYYGYSENVSGFNVDLIVQECANTADTATNIDFTRYDAVIVMLNSPTRVAIATLMPIQFPDNHTTRFGSVVIPSDKFRLALVAHEMGHAYGLPHSQANGRSYENPWDVMGIVSGYRCNVNADPIYSCLGQHTIAAYKNRLGWIPAERKYIAPRGTNTITLERLALPQTDNYLMAEVETPSGTYVIEARQRVGFDTKLADDAVLIHVYDNLVDIDGTAPYDDEGAIWRPGETFNKPEHGISVRVDAATATGFTVTINNANEPIPPPPSEPVVNVDFSTNTFPAKPGATMTFNNAVRYSAPSFSAISARVTFTFPPELTYQAGSATSDGGTIISQNPLVIDVDFLNPIFPANITYTATVSADLTETTVIRIPVTVEWQGRTDTFTQTVIVNGTSVYLPTLQR